MPDPTRRKSIASTVRQEVLTSRERFFRPEDFDLSPGAVDRELSRLAAASEVQRIRRGLYWRGSPTPSGMSQPPLRTLVEELVGWEGVGPTGAAAANELGVAHRPSQVVEVAVPERPPEDVEPVEFANRAGRTARRTAGLGWLEVAFLEVVERWEELVDTDTSAAVQQMVALLRDGTVSATRLSEGAEDEPASARERLKWLLSRAGEDRAAAAVEGARSPRTRERARQPLLQSEGALA